MCGCLSRALTGNQTSNPLVCRLALNPQSHTSQGIFFCPFTFSLYPNLKWVSRQQHMYRFCFSVCSVSLCLSIIPFSPFTFKVIIDKHVLTVILLFSCCFCSSLYCCSHALVSCMLMPFYSVFWFLSLYLVYVSCRFLGFGYRMLRIYQAMFIAFYFNLMVFEVWTHYKITTVFTLTHSTFKFLSLFCTFVCVCYNHI